MRQFPRRIQINRAFDEVALAIQKIFVLTDDNTFVPAGVLPNLSVRSAGQVEVEHMLAVQTA